MCRQCEQSYSVNLGEVSGANRKCLKSKINSIETDSINKNIRDLRRDISEFQKGHKLRSYLVTDKKLICLQNPTVFCTVRRNLLHNILTEFVISMNMARLIKLCLNLNYSRFGVNEYLSDISY